MLSDLKSKIKKPFTGKKSEIKDQEQDAAPVTPPSGTEEEPVRQERVDDALNTSEKQAKKKVQAAKAHGDATREETGANEERAQGAEELNKKSAEETNGRNTKDDASHRSERADGVDDSNVLGVENVPAAAMAHNAPAEGDTAQAHTVNEIGNNENNESNQRSKEDKSDKDDLDSNKGDSNKQTTNEEGVNTVPAAALDTDSNLN